MYPLEMNDVDLIRKVAKKSRSRICGFIMYTRADAFVAKVLKDDDYWDSLDAISGPNWPIFAVRPLYSGKKTFSCAGRKDGHIALGVPSIRKEPKENLKCLQFFNLDSTEQLPCFIAFYISDKNEVE